MDADGHRARSWRHLAGLLAALLAMPAAAPAQDAGPSADDGLEALLDPTNDASATASGEAATYPTVPVASDTPAPEQLTPKPARRQIEEIVVTARRTEENIQDVPVAIAAMSADDLRREQINGPSDLNGRVPSLVVGSNSQMRNTETPTIRGQGAQYGASPGVIIYLGEVPLPSDPIANYQGGAGKFFDLANLQILKGSQGTLFGRNTTGGALLLQPQKPLDEVSASLRAGAMLLSGDGNLTGHSYEAVFNTPLVSDTLLVRIGGQYLDRDGFTRDVVTGKDYDNKHYWTARAGLLWRPSDRVENYLMGYWSDSDDNGTATVISRVNREGLNRAIPGAIGLGTLTQIIPGIDLAQIGNLGCLALNVFGPSTNCGQDIVDEQAARGVRNVQLSGDPVDLLKTGAIVDRLSVSLTDTLTLVNIASYSTLRHSYRWDLDGSRAEFNEFINPENVNLADIRTITEELQLQGTAADGALQLVLGAYYEDTEASGRIIAKSLLFVDVDQQYVQDKRSFAPFVQGTYDLGHAIDALSGLSVTLGARHTRDRTTGTASIRQLALGLIPLVDKSFDAEVESAEWTWTAGLDYKLDTDASRTLLYGKVSHGYKTGGIAPISVNPARYTYDPEFVTNYEIGQKSDFDIAGIPARVNSAIYYTDYTDLQKAGIDAYVPPNSVNPVPQLGQSIFNVGAAWVAGFELDATLQPLENLTLTASYGYTRAEYTDFSLDYTGATPQLDCSGEEIQTGNVVELSCIPFQATPEQQFSVSGQLALPIDPANGDAVLALTYSWIDRQYSGQSAPPEAEPGAWLPAVGLLNASLSWRDMLGSRFSLQLYGSNLTNELYRISNSNQWNLTYFQSSIWSEPRIVGLNLSYDWQ